MECEAFGLDGVFRKAVWGVGGVSPTKMTSSSVLGFLGLDERVTRLGVVGATGSGGVEAWGCEKGNSGDSASVATTKAGGVPGAQQTLVQCGSWTALGEGTTGRDTAGP